MGSPRASNYLGQVLVYSLTFVEIVTNEFEFNHPVITLTGTQVIAFQYLLLLLSIDYLSSTQKDMCMYHIRTYICMYKRVHTYIHTYVYFYLLLVVISSLPHG